MFMENQSSMKTWKKKEGLRSNLEEHQNQFKNRQKTLHQYDKNLKPTFLFFSV